MLLFCFFVCLSLGSVGPSRAADSRAGTASTGAAVASNGQSSNAASADSSTVAGIGSRGAQVSTHICVCVRACMRTCVHVCCQ